MQQLTVSAPGKLMLMGEHAVVYGYPCLVTAVDSRFKLTLTEIDAPNLLLHAPDLGIIDYHKPINQIGKGDIPPKAQCIELSFKNFVQKYGINTGIKVETQSQFSQSYGFGSSSASIVCTMKALSQISQKKLTNQELFDLCYRTVIDKQGVGSGFDVAAAIWGGTLYFVTGGKAIEPLNINNLPLVIGYTGVKSDTTQIVKEIAKKKELYPAKIELIFKAISGLVEQGKRALLEKDWPLLGKLMNFNQNYLEDLGVSTEKLNSMVSSAKAAGALGAKLSGAGGGDCMIALHNGKNKQAIEKAIIQAGGEIVDIKAHAQGARIENL